MKSQEVVKQEVKFKFFIFERKTCQDDLAVQSGTWAQTECHGRPIFFLEKTQKGHRTKITSGSVGLDRVSQASHFLFGKNQKSHRTKITSGSVGLDRVSQASHSFCFWKTQKSKIMPSDVFLSCLYFVPDHVPQQRFYVE